MNIITKKKFFNILKLTLFMLCINLILPETFKAQNEIGNSTASSQVKQSNKSENKNEQSSEKTKNKENSSTIKETNTPNKNSTDSKPKTSAKQDSNSSENKQGTKPNSAPEKKVSEKTTNNKSTSTVKKETHEDGKIAESQESSEKKDNLSDIPALPELNDSEISNSEITNPNAQNITDSVSTPKKANIWLTVLSWALIGIGIGILLKVLFDNLKVPKEFGPGIKIKHASQNGKHKNKYNFKIK